MQQAQNALKRNPISPPRRPNAPRSRLRRLAEKQNDEAARAAAAAAGAWKPYGEAHKAPLNIVDAKLPLG